MRFSVNPLHPSQIRSADPEYRVDLAPETRETLRRRAEQVHPTMRTTTGRPEWRWGRNADRPATSGAPLVMSPTDLERAPADEQPSKYGSIDELRRRLKP